MPKAKSSSLQKSFFPKRPVPQMPEGYYSSGSNPNLRRFVEEHATPYDPVTDRYKVKPFDKPITTTKATAIYNMHTYWSKKPHDAIREYIKHYTKPGDLVLDPFCGSGGTALAALMEGRAAIAIDLSPAATFITKNYCTPVDVDELQRAFEELQRKVTPEMDWLYETRCDRCDGRATTAYTVYSYVFQCPRCLEKVALFDCPEVQSQTAAGKPKMIRICPSCLGRGHQEEIKTSGVRFDPVPVLVSYLCEEGCKPRRGERRHNDPDSKKRLYFETYDLAKITEIDSKPIPHWYPPHRMMNIDADTGSWGDKWRAGSSNFRTVAELYTKRNLWALSLILNGIRERKIQNEEDALLFAFQGILLINSKMCRYESTQTQNGTYYLPQVFKELYPLNSVANKVRVICEAEGERELGCSDLLISATSASELVDIGENTTDYIFTDPPYGGNVQYGELNFVWEAWLGFHTNWHDTIPSPKLGE
jgi:16S rRNA G966 N2-methylase RsmD